MDTIKKNDFSTVNVIEYVSKKEFKKRKKQAAKNESVSVIGQTKLSAWKERKHSQKEKNIKMVEFVMTENKCTQEKEYVVKPKIWGIKSKYVYVGNNQYVVVKHKFLIIILILLFGLLLGLGMNFLCNKNDVPADIVIGGEDIEEYDPQYHQENEMIEIPGLAQEYVVDANNKEIYLINPERNTVYFKYTVSLKDGKSIYQSDYIPPNQMEKVNLYDVLNSGEYELAILVETIDEETYEDCNSAQLETKIIVKK